MLASLPERADGAPQSDPEAVFMKAILEKNPARVRQLWPDFLRACGKAYRPGEQYSVVLRKPTKSGYWPDPAYDSTTPMHLAVQARSPKMVDVLAGLGLTLDEYDSRHFRPLHFAVYLNDLVLVKKLLARGSKVQMHFEPGSSALPPLYHAIGRNLTEISDHLIRAGSRVEGVATYYTLSGYDAFSDLDKNGHKIRKFIFRIFGFDTLLDNVAKIIAFKADGGRMKDTIVVDCIHLACVSGNLRNVELLVHKGATVNTSDTYPLPPLSLAVWSGNISIVKYLLQQGADPEKRSWHGATPLHFAAGMGQTEILKLLLRHTRDKAPRDNNGLTPRDWAKKTGHDREASLLR